MINNVVMAGSLLHSNLDDDDDDDDDNDVDDDNDGPLLSEPADESQTLNSIHGERRAEASLYKLYKCIFNINRLIALI